MLNFERTEELLKDLIEKDEATQDREVFAKLVSLSLVVDTAKSFTEDAPELFTAEEIGNISILKHRIDKLLY
ncbi:hypothetical protein [Bacillus rhizoplanae]|uniref:hypothetical protein n=1 Tax=Bacillus rhizoplanae TaxID=2880966 RepID=UPI003D25D934